MVLYDVYKRPLVIVHKTSVCSKATLFLILCVLLTVISPFLIVYRSQGELEFRVTSLTRWVVPADAGKRLIWSQFLDIETTRCLK